MKSPFALSAGRTASHEGPSNDLVDAAASSRFFHLSGTAGRDRARGVTPVSNCQVEVLHLAIRFSNAGTAQTDPLPSIGGSASSM
jgi:hypothetical protein